MDLTSDSTNVRLAIALPESPQTPPNYPLSMVKAILVQRLQQQGKTRFIPETVKKRAPNKFLVEGSWSFEGRWSDYRGLDQDDLEDEEIRNNLQMRYHQKFNQLLSPEFEVLSLYLNDSHFSLLIQTR
jgi:hypothetical protein